MSHDPSTPDLSKGLRSPFSAFVRAGLSNQNRHDRRHSAVPDGALDEIRLLKRAKARLKSRCENLRQQVDTLRQACEHDPLTGVYNRRGLSAAYDRLKLVKLLPGRGHAMVFLDGDGFGQINKIHGDDVGDQVIAAIAASLSRYIRRTDIVARKGGDEFIVILKNISPDDLDRIVHGPKGLAARVNAHTAVPVSDVLTLAIRASAGATFFQADEPLDEVLRRADQAMRGSKLYQKALKLLQA
jgi:diguanylate cyclase (GGDEF)-like protein